MTTSRRRPVRLAFLLLLPIWALAGFAGVRPPSLKIVLDRALPFPNWKSPEGRQQLLRTIAPAYGNAFLGRPHDLRWEDDGHVLVAAGRDGTFRLPVTAGDSSPLERAYAPLPDMGSLGAQMLLGVSREFLVASAPFHMMSWIPQTARDPRPIGLETSFNSIIDLDVAEDRLLVLGLRKLEKGKLAADGAIAWTAKLGGKLTEIRPVLISIAGPGARDTDACGQWLGNVRFLPAGGFVIVPGAEPGIFIYDASGKLAKTYQAETVGFDAGCPITEKEMYLYSGDIQARYRWLNQRRVVDELLPLPQGVGFVIRTRSESLTRWQLKVLSAEGKVISYDIPVTSPSEYARLNGDVRKGRIAFMLELDTLETPPAGSQHLIIAEVPSTKAAAARSAPSKKPASKSPSRL